MRTKQNKSIFLNMIFKCRDCTVRVFNGAPIGRVCDKHQELLKHMKRPATKRRSRPMPLTGVVDPYNFGDRPVK